MGSAKKLVLAGVVLVLGVLVLVASGFSEQERQVVVHEGKSTYVWHLTGSNEVQAVTWYWLTTGGDGPGGLGLKKRHYELKETK